MIEETRNALIELEDALADIDACFDDDADLLAQLQRAGVVAGRMDTILKEMVRREQASPP